jgi:hypothetical protein
VNLADEMGVDWRLAPAIALWESSSGRVACGANAWGIGSCGPGYRYETWEQGVRAAVSLLASPLYTTRSLASGLCLWVANDPGCTTEHARAYAGRVMATMEGLGAR